MRNWVFLAFLVNNIAGDYYESFSSSFSSSYSNIDGTEHSSSSASEAYEEKDSKGLNRRGSGKLLTEDGEQVYEETTNCDGGKCLSSTDTGKQRIRKKVKRH